MATKVISSTISIKGHSDLDRAQSVIEKLPLTGDEAHDRAILQVYMGDWPFHKVRIIYNGDFVWDAYKIIKNIKSIVNTGKMSVLTHYTHEFLYLACGGHSSSTRKAFIEMYPTVKDLKVFFICNEENQRVLSYIPARKAECLFIVANIERLLKI